MTREELTLRQTTDGYEYSIVNIQGVEDNTRKEHLSISPPGARPAENFLIGVRGMQGDISIRFMLHNDGTDRANGTAPVGDFTNDTVVTRTEQRRWLREYIYDEAVIAGWELTDETGSEFNGDTVVLTQISLPMKQQDSPKWQESRIELRRGESA